MRGNVSWGNVSKASSQGNPSPKQAVASLRDKRTMELSASIQFKENLFNFLCLQFRQLLRNEKTCSCILISLRSDTA